MLQLSILGIRGVPAMHGGFETFAEKLSLFLVEKGWRVTVYCQEEGEKEDSIWETEWKGIRRVHIPVSRTGALGTIVFDFLATRHALRESGLFLTLGYNTALFNLMQRFKGQINVINMDGIEWRREKWGVLAKTWFWINERLGCWGGNHLIADHPEIKAHLATRVDQSKITMIPYGGDDVSSADESILSQFGLTAENYSIIIARPEPENSILEMVRAFSRKPRGHKLLVLGNYSAEHNSYHRKILESAGDEVIFPGAIYDSAIVQSLRFYAAFYLHGHKVGGTNPSLVEALGAGCAVIAQDNKFNRWVAGSKAEYFSDESACANLFDTLLSSQTKIQTMSEASKEEFNRRFTWIDILSQYERLLLSWAKKVERS